MPGFFSESGRIFEGGKIAAASDGVVEFLLSYAGLEGLVAHGVADGNDGIGNTGGFLFRGDVELVFKGALEFVEGQAVDGVDYFGFCFRVGGCQPSYYAGFGRVGVDDVEGIGAEIIFQVRVSLKVFHGRKGADEMGCFDELKVFGKRKEGALPVQLRSVDQRHLVAERSLALRGVDRVLLGAALDEARYDVADLQLSSSLFFSR